MERGIDAGPERQCWGWTKHIKVFRPGRNVIGGMHERAVWALGTIVHRQECRGACGFPIPVNSSSLTIMMGFLLPVLWRYGLAGVVATMRPLPMMQDVR